MPAPAVGATTGRWYDRLPQFLRDADANPVVTGYALGWPLLRWLSLLGDQASEVDTLIDRFDAVEKVRPQGWFAQTGAGRVTTPDHATLDIAGDLELRALIAPDDWSPAVDGFILSKRGAGNDFAFAFYLASTGNLVLQHSTDGAAWKSAVSTANLAALAAGTVRWVRAQLDVDDGAGNHVVRFATAPQATDDADIAWTQLGDAVVTADVTAMFNSAQVVALGARLDGLLPLPGRFHAAEIRSGLAPGGAVVASPNFRTLEARAAAFNDTQGRPWTVVAPGLVERPAAGLDVPHSDLVEPAKADAAWLPWLAQLVGLESGDLTTQQLRDTIGSAAARARGSESEVAAIVAAFLTGTKSVNVVPGYGSAFGVAIVTVESETPVASAVILDAAETARPAGVIFNHVLGITWADLESDYPTWNAIEAAGSWQNLVPIP